MQTARLEEGLGGCGGQQWPGGGGRTLHKGERDAFFRKGCGDSVVMRRQEDRVGAGASASLNRAAAHGMKPLVPSLPPPGNVTEGVSRE